MSKDKRTNGHRQSSGAMGNGEGTNRGPSFSEKVKILGANSNEVMGVHRTSNEISPAFIGEGNV